MQAGMWRGRRVAIAVPDERMDRSQYTAANQILPSLEAFRPEEWGLPPFETSGANT